MKIKKLSSSSFVGPKICVGLLGVLALAMLCPITNNIEQANAWSSTSSDGSITLTIPDTDINQNATVVQAGVVNYRTYGFSISGGATNYSVALGAANGYTGELKGADNPSATIGKVGANTKVSDIAGNTWGYNLAAGSTTDYGSLQYNPVPDSSTNIVTRQKLDGGKDYKLVFAANIGADSPADHYQTKLYLSVVGEVVSTLEHIDNMQDMTSDICANTAVGYTKQLVDTRAGNKKYWVAKLADNNCWMTQNLDYDGGGTPITSIAGWTTGDGNAVTNNTAAYFDPGNYVYNGPNNDHGFVSSPTCNGVTSVTDSKCNGYLAAINPSSTDTTTQELMHYHIGNYYSWNAATNSSAIGSTSGEASGSICPTGWRLPTSNGNDKEFAKLMLAYGWTTDNPSNIALTMNGNKGIYGAPLYLTYGGALVGGQLNSVGDGGRYWSSTPLSNGTDAYFLSFNNNVNPSNFGSRYLGYSVRCVARDTAPEVKTFTLTYDKGNVSSVKNLPSPQSCTTTSNQCTVQITDKSPSANGMPYLFIGWGKNVSSIAPDYTAGSSITLTGDTTLYALWN